MAKKSKIKTSKAAARTNAIKALEKNGRIKPEDLVDAARNPKHPCHHEFTWDDTEAAGRWRIHQARTIISSVRVTTVQNSKTLSFPQYVRDTECMPHERGYVSTTQLQTEEDTAMDALNYELSRLQGIFERCREIAHGLGLENEFQRALNAILEFSSRARRGRPGKTEHEIRAT